MIEPTAISPVNVTSPTDAVAKVAIRIMSDLAVLRQAAGREEMQVEAMAMHNAALAVLRPDIGADGIRRMLELAGAENDRIEARDLESQNVGRRRRTAAARRSA